MKKSVVSIHPQIMGGTPCFRGTRVPVDYVLGYLEETGSLSEFLEGFPGVSREAVFAFLKEAQEALLATIQPETD